MKSWIGISLFALLAFTACNTIGMTDAEVQAVQKVLDFYGGYCESHKGFETDNGETETYFELQMSKSELIENYSNMLALPASNVAYLFYSNLKEGRDNYTYIKVKILLSENQSYDFSYSVNDLSEVQNLVPVLQTASDKIKAQDYAGLIGLMDTSVSTSLTVGKLEAFCMPYDSAYGAVTQTQFQGYSFFESEKDQGTYAHIAGIMIREKQNTPISVFIDRKSKKVMSMKYEF